ncbi:TPA: hypothetical protein PRY54_003929 [Escherichia coli]|uniref:F4 family fimbrial subunit n=1 Tax=Salmonella enterica TaxID=28901 RepID=UPI0009AC8510|nr:hypothetical protein [Salmonella enterica]EBW7049981.1 hypothetical protein [Salmonella enterica subsp. enterica serovar Muenchen]ECI7782070.1 hypothetical protein [Salmonella enterica subsp. enterica]EDV7203843.1 hypothetical protein [Salmonella enterica subsp. enterica serovar Bredeney]MBS9213430.1 hypothetical protein [Escherichia coli]EBI8251244.1 hypothetical protein [Salmonella enterica]
MKKNLIALCLAMASAPALAWTTGDFNGSIDIGGTIEKSEYKGKWFWKSGTGFDNFQHSTNELRNNGTKLVIQMTENKPILLGKTSEAFSTPTAGLGAVPNISFSDYQGGEVTLKAGTNPGRHYFDLPVKTDQAEDRIGTLRVYVTAAGVAAKEGDTSITFHSLEATQSSEVFYGGLVSAAVLESAVAAAEKTAAFGSLSRDELVQQIQAVNNSLTVVNDGVKSRETMVGTDNKVVSAAYAMGMSTGQTLEATFTKAVTTETKWKAPLNIVVSYQ